MPEPSRRRPVVFVEPPGEISPSPLTSSSADDDTYFPRDRSRDVARFVSLVSATIVALCAGSIAAFSLIAPQFQSRLHYSQFQVNGVAIGSSLALYLPISVMGYVCDRVGVAPLAILSSVLFGSGYGLAAAIYRKLDLDYNVHGKPYGYHDGWSYPLMVISFVCVGSGTCAMYISCVSTCAKNFGAGKHRGLALAMPVTGFGLSGMWLSQFASRFLYETKPDGSKGDVDVYRYLVFLAILLFVMGIVGTLTLRVVGELDLIEEAIDELEHSGILGDSTLLARSERGYGTADANSAADGGESELLLSSVTSDNAKWKKNWVLNAETRRFLTDSTMWPFAMGFFLMIGPGEAFVNNLGTVIGTLTPPQKELAGEHSSVATHVSIFGITSTIARLLIGTLTDLVAPSPETQHIQIGPSRDSSMRSSSSKRLNISRVVFMLFFGVVMSVGFVFLASGAAQDHSERFWVVSGLVGAGYGAAFSLTPLIVTIIWGVENFATNFGIVAMLPALGSTFWGLVYSGVYQAGAQASPDGRELDDANLCYEADTIRILVATDNHVGFEERDAIRKDDSWRTFDEIMNIGRTEDATPQVDMVLLAGDLFHDNKPSRKSLYQVMRTLRKNCLGMKPCPLEFLSDAAEVFEGAFAHVNYEDPDINVSIPVFSIHGNHDDPSGDGNFCSLDLLQASGLLNYFGRVAEADNIEAKPILLQKGLTKLALFGLSNVRDERMFRTFRDHKVKWFRPNVQMGDWFNLLALHQNHHAHTATSYLPENVLPDWLDLVVWGHEHECLIEPTKNPETGFHVMQPGSSVATSLVPGEAVQKHVAIISITGKEFKVDKIPLQSVRPFVTRELVLAQDKRFKGLDKKKDNRQEVTRRLMEVIDEMIDEADANWEAIQTSDTAPEERPLPLIRLKVEYTAPEGGQFEFENPQRFSNRFVGKVANINDVVYFYRKKTSTRKATATTPAEVLESLADGTDVVKVESLVRDFLSAQSLKVLPQGPFSDAVNQFVAKDDKHAMELFVSEHLTGQVKQLLGLESDDEDLNSAMEIYRTRIEKQMASGPPKQVGERKRILRPKPDTWDSDFDGNWEDEPDAWTYEDATTSEPQGQKKSLRGTARKGKNNDTTGMEVDTPAPKTGTRGRAGGRAAAKTTAKKPASTRSRRQEAFAAESDDEEEEDVIMESEGDAPPPPPQPKAAPRTRRSQAAKSNTSKPTSATRTRGTARTRQTTLSFSQKGPTQDQAIDLSDDRISDDDDFEPAPPVATRTRRR
ncbi:hypothetical protein CP533_2425 [Ophiocordyceps camponoti-saundersi (nom. inval.)]|nr:hypothetical protein CP533_2425 [Ophiocordyceps camponoti-saundersi (nom. inval.)]